MSSGWTFVALLASPWLLGAPAAVRDEETPHGTMAIIAIALAMPAMAAAMVFLTLLWI